MNKIFNDYSTLEEAIKNGASLAELREQFDTQLKAADERVKKQKQADIEKERKEKRLNIVRNDVIDIIMDYMECLDIIPEDENLTDEQFDNVVERLKDFEKEYVSRVKILNTFFKPFSEKEDKKAEKSEAEEVAETLKRILSRI